MKLLLTSAGLSNDSIKKAFLKLAKKRINKINAVYIPTAANIEPGDKWWLIDELNRLRQLGFAQLDLVDISAVPKTVWQPRLEEADVFFFGGGNTFHLLYWIKKSGLIELLPDLLKTRIWIGTSAGSMAPGKNIINDEDRTFAEKIHGENIGTNGLGYVPFSLKPHYLSPLFEGRDEASIAKVAEKFDEPMYAIDDNSAIIIDDNKVEVISEGKWKKFEK